MIRVCLSLIVFLTMGFAANAWRRAGSDGIVPHAGVTSRVKPFQPDFGVPYAIDCRDGVAYLSIPADGDGCCELVIGSVGNPDHTFAVTMDLMPVGQSNPVQPIVPLPRRVSLTPRRLQPSEPVRPFREPAPDRLTSAKDSALERTFFLHVPAGKLDDSQHDVPIRTAEIARGPHIRVLRDVQQQPDAQTLRTAAEIVRLFEEEIRPKSLKFFGPHHDVDGDGRLSVVLTPWLSRLQGGRTPLDGLVRPGDFRPGLARPFSNGCDVLFLNATVTPGPHLKALLAHEYTHVVCFSRRSAAGPDSAIEDDWLSEGIAHVAEQLHHAGFSNLKDRIRRFHETPHAYPLVISDYQAAGLWRNPGCRGATYLFLQWCVDQYGRQILRRMIDSPAIGVANIERATRVPFEELFRHWSLSLRSTGSVQPLRFDGSTPLTVRVRGTAVAFVALPRDSGKHHGWRLRIQTEPGARLQITLIRTPIPHKP